MVNLRGPGFKATTGQPSGTVVLGLTHATLGPNLRYNAGFWWHSFKTVASLPQNPGYLGHATHVSLLGGEAWTVTAWENEPSLNAFVQSSTHKTAMHGGFHALKSGRFGRLNKTAADFPLRWAEVDAELAKRTKQY